jgi:CHAD domain-containing protein
MQKQLTLNPELPLAEALAHAFEAMLVEARDRSDAALEAPATSVHNFRRALRRAEALLDLTAPFLRKRQLAWIDTALRRARRKTRLLRDLDALHASLSDFAPEIDALAAPSAPPADEGAEATSPRTPSEAIRVLIEAVRGEVASPELVAWRLRGNLRELAGLGAVFRAGLGRVEADALVESLRDTWRTARKAMKEAAREGTAEALHDWRKAGRVLRYQLELLGSAPALAADVSPHLDGVRELTSRLGELTDLFALHGLVRASDRATLGLSPRKLARGLEGLVSARTSDIFARADAVFALRARDLLAPDASSDPDAADEDLPVSVEDAEEVAEPVEALASTEAFGSPDSEVDDS